MGRKAKSESNILSIRPLADGKFFLSGYINGQQVRRQSRDLSELEALKAKLEIGALEQKAALAASHPLPNSWISIAQLRDAEAAFQLLGGSTLTLLACAKAGLDHLAEGKPVKVTEALKAYILSLGRRACPNHVPQVAASLRRFFDLPEDWEVLGENLKTRTISEYTPAWIEERVELAQGAAFTKASLARKVHAFFNFCVERAFLKASPSKLKVSVFARKAVDEKKRPKLLTAAQAKALLQASIEAGTGEHVPHVILGLWCGMRTSEVEEVTADNFQFRGNEAVVALDKTKTAAYRAVKVPECMVGLLRECLERGLIGDSPLGPVSYRHWLEIREKAGLIRSKKGTGTMPRFDTITWEKNILRHTGVSFYFNATENIMEVARQAGHSTAVAFQHYVAMADPEEVKKFYAVRLSLAPAKAPAEAVQAA